MGEPPGQHDGVYVAERRVAVPQQLGLTPEAAHGLDHVELAVRPREDDDPDARCHQLGPPGSTVTVASSMTGLVRKRLH
ncbi:MAG TPA: hypothetical protein VIX41_01495, partial [Acidimicrobiales bacterium]